jgi:hypothetical protein
VLDLYEVVLKERESAQTYLEHRKATLMHRAVASVLDGKNPVTLLVEAEHKIDRLLANEQAGVREPWESDFIKTLGS